MRWRIWRGGHAESDAEAAPDRDLRLLARHVSVKTALIVVALGTVRQEHARERVRDRAKAFVCLMCCQSRGPAGECGNTYECLVCGEDGRDVLIAPWGTAREGRTHTRAYARQSDGAVSVRMESSYIGAYRPFPTTEKRNTFPACGVGKTAYEPPGAGSRTCQLAVREF